MKSLRYLIPLAMVLLITLQAASSLHLFGWGAGPATSTSMSIGGPFRLTAPDGHVVTDRDFRGKWMLVYFGYTNCPDSCPTALNDVANALDMLGARAARIAPLFISIDPARDTPYIMGAYAAKFDSRILGLTGTPEQVAQVKAAYRVYAAPDPRPQQGRMIMDHSSIFVIMDPQGEFADVVDGNANPEILAAKLRSLMH